MTEPCTHLTTTTAPNGSLAASLAQGISQYAERFEEASVLEIAAAMSVEDPHAARSFLLERTAEPAFPMLRRSVLGTIELRIEAAKAAARDRLLLVTGDDAPGGKSDKAREAIFRRDPGAFLPGAEVSKVRPFARAFWHVLIDGKDVPCVYVCRAAVVSDLHDMVECLAENRQYERGIVIGAPETARDIAGLLPPNIAFVAVPLATDGRRA
ncbi:MULTISPECIES: hypothetical protein [Methylobacterium]|uniref:hypothetical protein n=1 Tax=Methylobacterium TaxID=407 RepID=UPI000D416B11|nr:MULTISPECIES: hypothetical protein [unclassified Methylobacterium]MCI9881860.1 hypothetical protein [Methylobacterium goesingense]